MEVGGTTPSRARDRASMAKEGEGSKIRLERGSDSERKTPCDRELGFLPRVIESD